MSEIHTKLKNDIKESMKAKDQLKLDLLRTIAGEVETESKRSGNPVTDEMMTKVLKGFDKNLSETIRLNDSEKAQKEQAIVRSYIPTQLDETGLRKVIVESGLRGMKDIMAMLKANYGGLYDGKLASQIAKEYN